MDDMYSNMDRDTYHKPTIDGRNPYYNNLNINMKAVNFMILSNDNYNALKALRIMFNSMIPYIKESHRGMIKELINKAYKEYYLVGQLHIRKEATSRMECGIHEKILLDLILDIHENIYIAGRDLFLTTSGDENTVFDKAKLLKGSKLS